ncbi:fatty acid-binding protein DegV [Enterococcus silesiacus]|uniref:DegV family EDD domain-containing protein n=1 Tax=Enterococcus silesiacus TaxID=332949 RepID=A0A0S3K907_9ENTE|nr:DegV family protein [Enterococcus silesiacus]ALS00800.1 fatty acid-binding protein DegV [Enterococcus silesiacus]OJG92303.1 DegV family EDD domain-containing protein [Enterococcus silesiacus]
MNGQSIDYQELLFAFQQGAVQLINEKKELNQINVFPVSDGDTGSNLASLMQTILEETKDESTSVIDVLEKIADASLLGARGNSGIIFAQYFNGIYNNLLLQEEKDSVASFVKSVKLAIKEAYQAISNPVEGTIITVIRTWAEALNDDEQIHGHGLEKLLPKALTEAEQALKNTTKQLKILQRNQVVDAGAKGFYIFIEGFTRAFVNKQTAVKTMIQDDDSVKIEVSESRHSNAVKPNYRYCTEILLEQVTQTKEEIQEKLSTYGDSLIVAVNRGKARIHIHSNQPDQVLSYLNTIGQPVQQKADDMLLQYQVNTHKKAPIALVTDSIADLPAEYVLSNQIHVLPMNILIGNTSYIDKVTIQSHQFFELNKNQSERATSAQPTLKTIENLFSFLETKYEAILVITVAEKLSGTFHTVKEAAKRMTSSSTRIEVIDSKQNSAAQGLLVMRANEWIQAGLPFDELVKQVEIKRNQFKILVSVDNLDPMIDSGRIPQFIGKIAKKVNLKPIVSLNGEGEGKLSNFAFSLEKNEIKVLQQLKKLQEKNNIKRYAVIHANAQGRATHWESKLIEQFGFEPNYMMDISTVIAMSAGQGSVAVAVEIEESGD